MNNFLDNFQEYNLSIFKDGMRLPEISVDPKRKTELGLSERASNFEYFKKLAWTGCLEKIASGKIKQTKEECIARLKEEFPVLEVTGVTDYFLFLRDILLWCDENGIARGPSRGSVGGCFTAFCVDIIYINPLDYDLTFSRFLSEARAKPVYKQGVMYVDGAAFCDIDIDLSQTHRGLALEEVSRRYPNRTAKILTLQELTGKMALKDTVKSFLEYGEAEALEISGFFESVFGKIDSIEKASGKSPVFQEWAENERNKEALKIARKIEGLSRSLNGGVHASGTLCCYYPLQDVIPLQLSEKGVVSGFDKKDCLKLSIKIDFLGILTLSVLKRCEELTGIKFRDIDVNDPSIYRFLQTSDLYYGLFQISEGITKDVTLKIKPRNINDINLALCIGRPGSIKEIPTLLKWLETGEKKEIHPQFDEVLKNTGNLIIFQEDINRVCQKIYKLSAVDADSIRAAIGKKKKEEMKKWMPILRKKGIENGIPEDVTEYFVSTCEAASDYLFSKNHSQAYSYVTAYTAYYKANFPLEYYLASLEFAKEETDPIQAISKIQAEMKIMDIKLLSPSLYKSSEGYSLEGKNGIRMGVGSIKGVSDKGLEKLRNFNREHTNKFALFESFCEAKLSMSIIAPLILAGCLDDEISSRSKILLDFELFKILTPKEKPQVFALGEKFTYDIFKIVKAMSEELKDEKGKPLIKPSRFETIKRNIAPYTAKYKENVKNEELSNIVFEQELLGFNYSNTLHGVFSKRVNNLIQLAEGQKMPEKARFRTICFVDEVEKRKARTGRQAEYLVLTCRDESSKMRGYIWGVENMEAVKKQNGRDVAKGDLIIAEVSRKHEADGWLGSVIIQDCPTVMKVSQLKKEG
jgi:DNA polymerase-3 subunit alpha